MARRLTDIQVAVLAAIERLGQPTLPELKREAFPHLNASSIGRVAGALHAKGKVGITGNPYLWLYAGEYPGVVPDDEVVRFYLVDEYTPVAVDPPKSWEAHQRMLAESKARAVAS
jgi:hypothetical protein